MAKGKMKSTKGGFKPTTGKGHMFGKQKSGPAKSGVITHSQPGSNKGFKVPKTAGSGKMFGFTGSKPAMPR